ncbi:MAG: multiple antibiotic resistance protein [Aliidongia sp.]|jgi:multiple antibiotic resistance protein|nr:multiple antibiotic resistance protein [Aliidongia sp.]
MSCVRHAHSLAGSMNIPWTGAADSFLLAFPALLSIVNPIAGALIYSQVTAGRTPAERTRLAGKIGFYAALVMLVALWGGAYVLNFFGISLAALRIAGGLVVAVRAWEMLSVPEQNEAMKQEQAAPASAAEDVAFFPLTVPFTTGPGTISVAVALGSTRPASDVGLMPFFLGVSAAAVATAVVVWIAYRSADSLVALLGQARARVVTRITAFLLLCIGTQILLNGAIDVLTPLLAGRRG